MSLGASRATALWRVTLPQIAAVAGVGGIPRLHLVVRRTRGRDVPRRLQHDLAEEDVRQHRQRDRSDHRGRFGHADLAGHRGAGDRLAPRQRRRTREIDFRRRAPSCSVRKSLLNGEPAVRSRTTSCTTRARCAPSCDRGRSRPRMMRNRFGIAGRNGTTATGIAGDTSNENGSTIATPAPASARSIACRDWLMTMSGSRRRPAAAVSARRSRKPIVRVLAKADDRRSCGEVAHSQRPARRPAACLRGIMHTACVSQITSPSR